MSASIRLVAIDLGAESGRAVVGSLNGKSLSLEEVHRFPNEPVRVCGSLHWDVLRLFLEIKRGLSRCAKDGDLAGVGIDTWGVDFGLLGKGDILLGNPYHYRDRRTDGMVEKVCSIVPREEIFRRTGIQFMKINTLYQLRAMMEEGSPLLEVATTLLFMPDLFNFFLTGEKKAEFSIASTGQVCDPRTRNWAWGLLQDLDIPVSIFPEIIQSGTVLGDVLGSVAEEIGIGKVPVIAPACHDTGSAVVAVPAVTDNYAYLSSGTWSLMGVEVREPVINDLTLNLNFTNEGGVAGTFRLLKNIAGLWLVQECRRAWEREGEPLSYDEITALASRARPLVSFVDPDREEFISPRNMPEEIQRYCRRTGQPVPEGKGEIVRCALESLALRYRWTLEKLEEISGKRIDVIHIVGGGTKNKLLCQFTADATKRQVVAGPQEATAIGNIMVQAMALGHVRSLQEVREVVRASFPTSTYEPLEPARWDDAYGRFLGLLDL